jgi:hypothetical protein
MKAITVSELKANVGKIVDEVLEGEPCLIVRNGKFALLRSTDVIPDESALHQAWIDEALASGPHRSKPKPIGEI